MRPKTAGSTLPVDNQRASSPPPPFPPLGPHPRHTAGPTPSSSPSRGANAALTSASSAALAASRRARVRLPRLRRDGAQTLRLRLRVGRARRVRGDRRRRRERPRPPRAPPLRSPFEVRSRSSVPRSARRRNPRAARASRVSAGMNASASAASAAAGFFLLRRSPRQRRRERAQTPRPTRRGGFRVRQHRAAERERGRRGDARRAIVRRRVVLGFPAAPVRAIAFSFAARVCVSVSAAALGGKKTLERG